MNAKYPTILVATAALALCASSAPAQPRSASVTGYGHSVFLGPTSPVNDSQLGTLTAYFTTPDGRTDIFPIVDVVGQIAYFGGEMKPNTPGNTSYLTDYAFYSSWYGWVEKGTAGVVIPSTDSDGNGVFDFIQFNRGVNQVLSGGIFPDTGGSEGFTGTFIRSSGSRAGSYSLILDSGAVRSGSWNVASVQGTANYVRGEQNTVQFSVTAAILDSESVTTAITPYTINNANQITIQPMLLSTSDSLLFTQSATTMNRSGNTYRGLFTLIDGNSETSWQDYKQYTVEITDTNDSDSDGIPDLSDPIPHPAPRLTINRRSGVVDIKWPNTAFGFTLQSKDSIAGSSWVSVGASSSDSGGMKQVTVGAGAATKFFRLAH